MPSCRIEWVQLDPRAELNWLDGPIATNWINSIRAEGRIERIGMGPASQPGFPSLAGRPLLQLIQFMLNINVLTHRWRHLRVHIRLAIILIIAFIAAAPINV